MTDEQIIKALECCSTWDRCQSECPYDGKCDDIFDCTTRLAKDALALIKRLKEEKEEQFGRLGKEIYAHCSKIVDLQERLAFERAEAIREFAERLDGVLDLFAKGLIEELELYDKIAELKREMTEEQK